MVGPLLVRGMLVGLLAGLLCFGFLKVVGEPQVDRAIAFEARMDHAEAGAGQHAGMAMAAAEPELVSRETQAGLGLFVGVEVYSAAFGGLFALAFAAAYGRVGDHGPRAVAALLAAAGLVAVYVAPSLKYPANPPAVGEAETIGLRTALYFVMIALSLAAMIGAGVLRSRLLARQGAWNASLIAMGAYLAVVAAAALALPGVDEVPEHFPATVLWNFRMAALGSQVVLWATLGLVFGALTERAEIGRRRLLAMSY